ncbi:MAG TPA: HIT domain-containing protein [Anaerolineae bacterium]|nr:HIT domain-containing protein [Anaerolineae bacterium]
MDHIWSPWRMEYIQRGINPKGCIFCDAIEEEDDIKNLIIKRGKKVYVILNRYPYTNGHVMVVPYAHESSLEALDGETKAEIMELITQSIQVITKEYKPEGFNIGANMGAIAGAGVKGHVHFHVVPRWSGDTNFMTSVGHVRVLPEDLCETCQRLKESWPK